MLDLDPLADRQARLAADLDRARRHATWLERIAAMALAFASTTAVLALAAAGSAWLAVGLALAGAAAWGLLRTLALVLHIRVSEVALSLPDGASHRS